MAGLRIGILGCGSIVQAVHIRHLTRMPEFEVVALAEPDPERRAFAQRFAPKAQAVTDYRAVLERPDVEAVFICLPTGLHAEAALAALARNKYIYLEKPIATSQAEAGALLAAGRRSDRTAMVGFNYRFHPLYRKLREAIQSGRAGELTAARALFACGSRPLPAWKQTRATGGGALLDLASHHADLIPFFFAQPVCEVSCRLRSLRAEEDTAFLELRLRDGLVIQSFFSLSAVSEDTFTIYGQAGKLEVRRYRSGGLEVAGPYLDSDRFSVWTALRGFATALPYRLQKLRAPAHELSYRLAFAHFAEMARAGQPAEIGFLEGWRSLAVVLAAEESARIGKSVLVDTIFHAVDL